MEPQDLCSSCKHCRIRDDGERYCSQSSVAKAFMAKYLVQQCFKFDRKGGKSNATEQR